MRPTSRAVTMAVSAGLVAATLAFAPTTTSAQPSEAQAAAARGAKTTFALSAHGYGTVVRGGQLPTSSDSTAFTSIGCTTRAGIKRANYEVETTVPGLGTLSGVRTRLWTRKRGDVVSSYATHRIAELVIADNPLGKLSLEGIRAKARAFHDGKRFRTEEETQVAKIVFTPAAGAPQEFEIPTPGEPILIPGVARISIGNTVSKRIDDGVRSIADALIVNVIATNTRSRVAHAAATIQRGAPFGTFRGFSAGIRARALDDSVKIGRTPLLLMPCKGTDGNVKVKGAVRANPGGQVVARTLNTRQSAKQTKARATAFEQGSVGRVVLGGGQVVLNGIVARANVVRTSNKLVRSAKGTKIGSLVINGEERSFPRSGVIEIPGLVKIEERIVTKIRNGIAVVGVRLTLLDGTGAVIDLAISKVQIRKG